MTGTPALSHCAVTVVPVSGSLTVMLTQPGRYGAVTVTLITTAALLR